MANVKFRRALLHIVLASQCVICSTPVLAAGENTRWTTMATLLKEAENGDLNAVINAAAGGPLVFPDGGILSRIALDDERIVSLRKSISVDEALTVIASYYIYGLIAGDETSGEIPVRDSSLEACVWLFRAVKFSDERTLSGLGDVSDLGKTSDESKCRSENMKKEESSVCFKHLQRFEMAKSIYTTLSDGDKRLCDVRGGQWPTPHPASRRPVVPANRNTHQRGASGIK